MKKYSTGEPPSLVTYIPRIALILLLHSELQNNDIIFTSFRLPCIKHWNITLTFYLLKNNRQHIYIYYWNNLAIDEKDRRQINKVHRPTKSCTVISLCLLLWWRQSHMGAPIIKFAYKTITRTQYNHINAQFLITQMSILYCSKQRY